MSKRHFSILLVLVVVSALVVALLVPGKSGRESESEPVLLLPEVGHRINDAEHVTVQGSGQRQVRLNRQGGEWVIADLTDYPADWNRLRTLLADLAQAEIVETKTDNPAYYDRLGVEDPEQEGAQSTLVTVTFGDDQRSLIVGKKADSRSGQYVRPADSATSLLVDREFSLPLDPVDWAERDIVDVPSGEVREVEIIHPDGDWILVKKSSPDDTDFVLENLAEGRETVSSWSVNSLAGALSALAMEGVEPVGDGAPEDAVRFRLLTFSGTEYLVHVWEAGESHWLTLSATRPLTGKPAPPTEAEPAAGAEEPLKDGTDYEDALETAAFNQRVSEWKYRIPEYKYTSLTKRLEDLLKPLDEEADGEE